MGAYLASPICDKDTIDGSNNDLAFAASSMQGWRMSQEDAHNAILNFDDKTSFFAVYDGHGGAEIALYCSRHLPDFIKQLDSYREGRLHDALVEGFLKFDSLLLDPKVKEILQEIADAKDKIEDDDDANDDDDEQIDDRATAVFSTTNANEANNHNDELNVEEAHLLRKDAELPIEELLKQYSGNEKHLQSLKIFKQAESNPLTNDNQQTKTLQKLKKLRDSEGNDEEHVASSIDFDQIKTDVVSHADEENTPADDVLDHKIAETTTNGEISDAVEAKPSSSEPKTTSRRSRKPISTDTTIKTTSLTHHLLSENIDDLDDDDDEDEDGDDFELEGSDDETSDDDDDEDEGEDDAEEETEEEDDGDEDKQVKPNKAAQIKKLMKKSIMAILNRHTKKRKHGDYSEDDAKENRNTGNDDDEYEDVDGGEEGEEEDDDAEEEGDDEDDDNENDVDLGKMLNMTGDPGSSSGCTAVVTVLRDRQLFVANAGDSRCVVSRNGRAVEMSIDHKPEDSSERSRIEKAGYKVTLDGRVSGGLNLSRAIGDHAYKKTMTLPADEQAITALPDIKTLTLEDQDEFMVIACDGIWNSLSSQEVVDFVRTRLDKKRLTQICEELFSHCLAPNTSGDGTGCDNMTAIIVKFNFNQSSKVQSNAESEISKSTEHSPWSTMFSSTNNKRSLSPDHTTTELTDSSSSKKLKIVAENGLNETLSPSKTTGVFSFNAAAAANANNSNDDQQN